MGEDTKQAQPGAYRLHGTALAIADRLGETEDQARRQLARIVWALGESQAEALLDQALSIEAAGGQLTKDGSRRRTPGGVFFELAYSTGKPETGKHLNRPAYKPAGTKKTAQPAQKTTPAFNWEDRVALVEELKKDKGVATTVKITLVGKLGKWQDRGQFVAAVMQSMKAPALPKGVPTPAATNTSYVIYVGAKQWRAVEAAAKDEEDSFIIEGFPQVDTKTGAINVFVTAIASRRQQMAKREAQKAQQEQQTAGEKP